MVRKAALIALTLALAGPASAAPGKHPNDELITLAKARVSEKMRDPQSVQFRRIRVIQTDTGPQVCGEYNAKNGYGGYEGFEMFLFDGHIAQIVGEGNLGILVPRCMASPSPK